MFLTDTHCHINDEYYADTLDEILKNAVDNDVKRLIFASCNIPSSCEAVAMAREQKKEPTVYALVGIHPHEADSVDEYYLSDLESLCKKREVIGIGEIGLDYFYDISPRDIQKKIFREQVALAIKRKMPIILHIRDAENREEGDAMSDTLDILEEMGAEKVGGIVHCFSGNEDDMKRALAMNFYIAFGGTMTFPRSTNLREVAMKVPMDRLLCETDSPYLSPQGYRGKTNEPSRVKVIYEKLAMLKEMELDEFAKQIHENVNRLFRLEEKYV